MPISARPSAPPGTMVSVVVPTFHRPEGMRAAALSVLNQQLPPGCALEVVLALSDPSSPADTAAAAALAAADSRVRVAEARRPGPAAARNAGLDAARSDRIAFLDDDCVAQPGWLAAGLRALEHADLVQGRTRPAGEVPRYHHSLWVEPPSWLWESCNLLVRRQAVDAHGGFDESWNPTGRVGGHMGEDVEWGWRLVHGGAVPGYAPDALVLHEVRARDLFGYLEYQAQLRHFPLLFRAAPEARRVFWHRYFVNQRHFELTLIAGLLGAGAMTRRRHGGLSHSLFAAAALLFLKPHLDSLEADPATAAVQILESTLVEGVELGAALAGSVRHRRLLV